MKKKLCTIIIMFALTLGVSAQQGQQPGQRFSPEQFEADLQAFITKEANLTPQEAAKFFPLYKEMQNKQRALFERQRQLATVKPTDEQGCLKSIKDRDALDLELKQVQQTYHLRFLEQLPASKVYDILKAEDRFHRRMMKNWGRTPQGGNRMPQGWGGTPQGGNRMPQGWGRGPQTWGRPPAWPQQQQ